MKVINLVDTINFRPICPPRSVRALGGYSNLPIRPSAASIPERDPANFERVSRSK